MSAASTVLAGRRFNETLMDSECIIFDEVLDDETGGYVPAPGDPTYSGPCKIRFNSTVTSDVDAQSQLLVEQDAILSLPIGTSGDVQVQQVCQITANVYDPALVGKRFRITGDHTQTLATARRFPVELVSRG